MEDLKNCEKKLRSESLKVEDAARQSFAISMAAVQENGLALEDTEYG